jgi:hypothetical protein
LKPGEYREEVVNYILAGEKKLKKKVTEVFL